MMMRRLALCCLLLTLAPTSAWSKWITPGDEVKLDKDEGVAVFRIDSDADLSEIRLDRIGSVFSMPSLKKLSAGKYLRLLKLPAGEYKFDSLRLIALGGMQEYSWEFDDQPNSTFRIEAGKINYVGDVVTRGGLYRRISVRNAALAAMDTVEHDYPGLIKRYPVRYCGDMPDEFYPFLIEQQQKFAKTPAILAASLPKPRLAERDLAEILFRRFEVSGANLDPSGKYLVEYAREGDNQIVRLVNLDRGLTQPLYTGRRPLFDLEWINASRLVLTYWDQSLKSRIVDIESDGRFRVTPIEEEGFVLGVLPGDQGDAVFAAISASGRALTLFPINLSGKLDRKTFKRKNQIHPEVKNAVAWMMDTRGVPRVAWLAADADTTILYFADDGTTHRLEIKTKPDESLTIAGFDSNNRLLAMTNRDREQVELALFDPITGKVGDTVFGRPGTDVLHVVLDRHHAVVGAAFIKAGQLETRFFEEGDRILLARLQAALPELNIRVDPETSAGRRKVFAYGPTNPGSYYILQEATSKLDLASSLAPHLEERPMLSTRRIMAKASDGFEIESFLTRRPGSERIPLLVLPHGGPVGVFDMKNFDPEVQFFAQLGYAVLQVNYRGSGNKGTGAHKDGFGQWGKRIEADVNAAVDHIISLGGIDTDRIAAMGTSYGGYSALMLGVLWPERYKAAVSIAGVSDIPLQFSSGDITRSRELVDTLVKFIGDPRKNLDELTRASPVYRYEEINHPVLLIHDRNDQRVAYEHTRRLEALMKLRGKPVQVITVDDGEHGLVQPATRVSTYPKIAAFLDQALDRSETVASPLGSVSGVRGNGARDEWHLLKAWRAPKGQFNSAQGNALGSRRATF